MYNFTKILFFSLFCILNFNSVQAQDQTINGDLSVEDNIDLPFGGGSSEGNLFFGFKGVISGTPTFNQGNMRLFYNKGSNGFIDVKTPNSTGGLRIRVSANSQERTNMFIAANRRVGINTSTPAAALEVEGNNILLESEVAANRFAALGVSGGFAATNCDLYGFRAQSGLSGSNANSVNLGVEQNGTAILNWGNPSRNLEIRVGTQSNSCGALVATFSPTNGLTTQNMTSSGSISAQDGFWTVAKDYSPGENSMMEKQSRTDLATDRIMNIETYMSKDDNIEIYVPSLNATVPQALRSAQTGIMMIDYNELVPAMIAAYQKQELTLEKANEMLQDQAQKIEALQVAVAKLSNSTSAQSSKTKSVELSVRPNPSRSLVNIDYTITEPFSTANLTIYTLSGQVLITREVRSKSGYEKFDVSQLPRGRYTYSLNVDDKLVRSDLLVVH